MRVSLRKSASIQPRPSPLNKSSPSCKSAYCDGGRRCGPRSGYPLIAKMIGCDSFVELLHVRSRSSKRWLARLQNLHGALKHIDWDSANPWPILFFRSVSHRCHGLEQSVFPAPRHGPLSELKQKHECDCYPKLDACSVRSNATVLICRDLYEDVFLFSPSENSQGRLTARRSAVTDILKILKSIAN